MAYSDKCGVCKRKIAKEYLTHNGTHHAFCYKCGYKFLLDLIPELRVKIEGAK